MLTVARARGAGAEGAAGQDALSHVHQLCSEHKVKGRAEKNSECRGLGCFFSVPMLRGPAKAPRAPAPEQRVGAGAEGGCGCGRMNPHAAAPLSRSLG